MGILYTWIRVCMYVFTRRCLRANMKSQHPDNDTGNTIRSYVITLFARLVEQRRPRIILLTVCELKRCTRGNRYRVSKRITAKTRCGNNTRYYTLWILLLVITFTIIIVIVCNVYVYILYYRRRTVRETIGREPVVRRYKIHLFLKFADVKANWPCT